MQHAGAHAGAKGERRERSERRHIPDLGGAVDKAEAELTPAPGEGERGDGCGGGSVERGDARKGAGRGGECSGSRGRGGGSRRAWSRPRFGGVGGRGALRALGVVGTATVGIAEGIV